MVDDKYCYPNSDVLINKLNITDDHTLFLAEKKLTFVRLQELQTEPINGNFNYTHLKSIHGYIFQDLYSWAGKERTVEIGKGNQFCPTRFIRDYADSVFSKYFPQCYSSKNNFSEYVKAFAKNYGDLNALHPFREGNGRAQREFARLVCLKCGYDFDLSKTSHNDMLEASKLSFNKGDNSLFVDIFSEALTNIELENTKDIDYLKILTSDDMTIGSEEKYDYYEIDNNKEIYHEKYRAKIKEMDSELNDTKEQSNESSNYYMTLDEILEEVEHIQYSEKTQYSRDDDDFER